MAQEKDYLSANDLSIDGFLTAEENDIKSASSSGSPFRCRKVHASQHERSEGLCIIPIKSGLNDCEDAADEKSNDVGASSSTRCREEHDLPFIRIANDEHEKEVSIGSGEVLEESTRLAESRQSWHKRSLLNRSCALEGDERMEVSDVDAEYVTCVNSMGGHTEAADALDINAIKAQAGASVNKKTVDYNERTCCKRDNNNEADCVGDGDDVAGLRLHQHHRRHHHHHHGAATLIRIQIEEYNMQVADDGMSGVGCSESRSTSALNSIDIGASEFVAANNSRASHQINLPPPPPPSPTSDSAIDVNWQEARGSSGKRGNGDRLKPLDDRLTPGSLSDNSHERMGPSREALLQKRQMQRQLKDWKKSNKIITHIRENPFNTHIECLEQLEAMSNSVASCHTFCDEGTVSKNQVDLAQGNDTTNTGKHQQLPQQQQQQQQQLQSYATHLSYLYRKNQAVMDNNSDFRSLLYNIICCLLTQDEQILTTPSVTKMIDVIRTHLESASKFYSAATQAFANSQHQQVLAASSSNHLLTGQVTEFSKLDFDKRKNSLGSQNSSSSAATATTTASHSSTAQLQETFAGYCHQFQQTSTSYERIPQVSPKKEQSHFSQEMPSTGRSRQKPVDFRRVSSVSYNDEQLINDLCDGCQEMAVGSGGGHGCSSRGPNYCGGPMTPRAVKAESPWRYEELSQECKHHHTSQSSLERDNNSFTLELMNDSGIGTIYDFQADEFLFKSSVLANRKRHSDIGEFKPKRQLSYVSSDDNLSRLANETDRTSIYDEESHSTLQRRTDLHEPQPVDVASRRAELEWTLNKLINFELKYTWLTSKDTLRRAIRKIGVPNEIRGKVWSILIEQMIGTKYDVAKLLQEADKTIADGLPNGGDEETLGILKQIDLDVNRTMPGHKLFDDGAEGGIKLRRILVAYSIHVNRAIAYCQGFNFIVALLLSVFEGDEEKALRGFICVVDHIFPSKFYFDHYLTGARADQFLLADFICDQLIKNPTMAERKMLEGVTSSITLNWFISLFHGAVPTLTRLTILDHFMLEGVKALFRFTMAILYLAFQVTPPSSCDVYATIRNTAKDMYDIKLLLSIVEQIKLPKDSYFAIRRSFYMVQSSFNSDQFYMQSLSNDASRQLVSNKPLSVQQLPYTKQPAMSLITAASYVANNIGNNQSSSNNNSSHANRAVFGPRVCISSDRSKVCIQTIGKLGRSHLKIMDANTRSNERSLMSPLRNCLVIGIANCGKNLLVARQASRRGYKTFREQDLMFHVHELCAEIFDGFYLESSQLAIISTHSGEIIKIDVSKCYADSQIGSTETLLLRDSHSIGEHAKLKLRLVSIDALTNLLWVHIECEDTTPPNPAPSSPSTLHQREKSDSNIHRSHTSNPFWFDLDENQAQCHESQARTAANQLQRKILIIDITTFDIFSAFTLHQSFGDIISMRTSLVAFCQLANPMSNQFSSRIVRIGPTGRYEHLLSFSDVVDFMISGPEAGHTQDGSNGAAEDKKASCPSDGTSRRYSTIKRLLPRSFSFNYTEPKEVEESTDVGGPNKTTYIPVIMVFIFRNGKIALFEFTESYAIHTRESQLDRYDYSKVIDVSKNGDDFIITILTVFDRLIKVVI